MVVGKTNMDEFGMGSTTETSACAARRTPGTTLGCPGARPAVPRAWPRRSACWRQRHRGSIRQPASFCGVVGFAYGLVRPRSGRVRLVLRLPRAAGVEREDAAIALALRDGDAATSRTPRSRAFPEKKILSPRALPLALEAPGGARVEAAGGKKFALVKETPARASTGVIGKNHRRQGAGETGRRGGRRVGPTFGLGLPAYYVLALEASSNLARYDAIRYDAENTTRSEGLGAEVAAHLMGTYALSAGRSDAYWRAQRRGVWWRWT